MAHKAKKKAGGGGGGGKKKKVKGDARILVSCDEVKRHIFGYEDHDGDTAGSATSGSQHGDQEAVITTTNTNGHVSAPSYAPKTPDTNHSYDDPSTGTLQDPTSSATTTTLGYIDGDVLARMSIRSGTRIRPPQAVSEVNGNVGGEKGKAERIEETGAMLEKRLAGQRRARHREMVRCAARRGVVFGFCEGDSDDKKRKCEAVMLGKVVEPSFAKGDWSIRWRE